MLLLLEDPKLMSKINLILSNESYHDGGKLSEETLTFLADVACPFVEYASGIPIRYRFEELESRFDQNFILAIKIFEKNDKYTVASIEEEKKVSISIHQTDLKEVIDYVSWA